MCVCVSSLRNVKLCSFLKVEKKIFSPCVIVKSLRCGRETISNLSVEGGASRNSGRSAGFFLQVNGTTFVSQGEQTARRALTVWVRHFRAVRPEVSLKTAALLERTAGIAHFSQRRAGSPPGACHLCSSCADSSQTTHMCAHSG